MPRADAGRGRLGRAARSRTHRGGERAAATVLVVPAALALCSLSLAGIGRLGSVTVGGARADAVADLTALAAVTGGGDAARRVAGANGARLERLDADAAERTVTVVVDGRASSATAAPTDDGGG